ncbi:MAG: hypothetical protein K1X57_06110 [Gemmataceae bacterium]|nr:hypothetical protein [Gemmataceae bacterium]
MFDTRCRKGRIRSWVAAAVTLAAGAGWAGAQDAPEGPLPNYAQQILEGKTPPADKNLIQAGCCGQLSGAPMITGSMDGGAGPCPPGCPTGHCTPGRKCPTRFGSGCSSCGGGGCGSSCAGDGCEYTSKFGRLCDSLFSCWCCPDPCYEPQWLPTANAAMFTDHARPQTHMKIGWNMGMQMNMPDRNEFWWARIGRKGPANRTEEFNYHELTMYNETATGAFGMFIEMPYRLIEGGANGFDAGWGDMNLGTKTMFVDCELMQLTFQFRTYIPIGSTPKGFGTGHVSLEPSLLAAVKLGQKTWFEGQFSEWIPVGGDKDQAGMVFHYHTSINHLWCQKKSMQFITMLEYQGYAFQDGLVTNPANFVGPERVKSSREAYHYLGPGARVVICDNFDIGFGAAFSLTNDGFADQLYRTEFRLRF